MGLSIKKTMISGVALTLALAGCDHMTEEEKNADLGVINVIDAVGLSDVMLNLADPAEAVKFFRRSLAEDPENVSHKRNLALALVRAREYAEATLVFEQLIETGEATSDDRVAYAESLVRNGVWDEAKVQLDAVPPTIETFDRYFLEALIADHNKEWEKADRFYDVARGLTTRPAQVLNNWGISKSNRGQTTEAEKLFKQAITADPTLFAAKNNWVISRAKRSIYQLPVMPTTDTERAILFFNIAREALNNGDKDIALGLLDNAIDTHPQFFEPAVALRDSL